MNVVNDSVDQVFPRDAAGLFRQLVLLDRAEHRGFRVQPATGWQRARAINAVPLAVAEFVDATREMPVAFIPTPDKSANGQPQVLPIAMLGLREAENLFVDADGRWDGRFLPASLRRYPFAMVRTAEEQLSVVVDAAFEGLAKSDSDKDGELLIDAEGEPTTYTQNLVSFLERFEAEMQRTRLVCDRLVELELLRSAEVNGDLPGGGQIKADGFFMVDEEKLANLPDAVVLELHRNGMLGLIHMHLHSMGNVQGMAERVGRRMAAADKI